MPRFFNNDKKYWISTSYKVMYTTLLNQSELSCYSSLRFASETGLDLFRKRSTPNYMIMRNPYDRIVSCFSDKFRRSPVVETRWEHCQEVCFPLLGLDINDDFEKIRERLLGISFEEFIVDLLPIIWRKDGHFHPQYFLMNVRLKKVCFSRISIKEIFRMEEDLPQLQEALGVDISIHKQKSSHESSSKYFTEKTRKIVNSIYARDFKAGGYEVLVK